MGDERIEGPQRQELARNLFGLLKARGIAAPWADCDDACEGIAEECRALMLDEDFRARLSGYLATNQVIRESIEAVVYHMAFSAGVDWSHAKPLLQPFARRGSSLARWLPTFLLIDGPLGRFLKSRPSPLVERLRTGHASFPLLCSARDAFNHDLFRKVRNGFAHWSFTWTEVGEEVRITTFHFESGEREAEVSALEAEALHFLSSLVTQFIELHLLRPYSPSGLALSAG